jgi:GDP/GTP exchange factor Sec2p
MVDVCLWLVAEKLADYEDEIRRLRSKVQELSETKENSFESLVSPTLSEPAVAAGASSNTPSIASPPPSHSSGQHATRLSTLTSFLPYRRGASNPAMLSNSTSMSSNSDLTSELQNALSREQTLRKAAETQLSQANSELEELTVQLFTQANEMVSQERKARAKLEERVAVLERRDGEKRKRLDRLEKAIERVERVRNMIG